MSHVRQQLLDALVAAVTNLVTTGPRVLKTRTLRAVVPADQLPCLLVYREGGNTEDIEDDAMGDEGALMRRARYVVKGVVKESENAEELLDIIAAEVETAVPRDLGDIAIDCVPVQTRFIYPGTADRETCAVEIEFAVMYRTRARAPEAAI